MKINIFKNKTILITGGTGSIGSALVKGLIKKNCKVIRAMSNDENGLYDLSELINNKKKISFSEKMKKNKIRYILGDIRDYKRCLEVTKDIDIIIHAAALKHVPLCEFNPKEAYNTNVKGTKNLIKASKKNNIKKFLFISTDKVVNPVSVMGKTKKIAEKFILNSNKKNNTLFSCIRFGNIIGSRGSVLPKFKKQIKDNENLSLTDKNMKRYFLTIDKAVKNILLSIDIMKGNEIFIIGNLPNFKIMDLAEVIKKYYKKILGYNKKIIITGIRSGERLNESLYDKKKHQYIFKYKNLIIINEELKANNKIQKYKYKIKRYYGDYSQSLATNKYIEKYLIVNNLLNINA